MSITSQPTSTLDPAPKKTAAPKATGRKMLDGVELVHKGGKVVSVEATRVDALEKAIELGAKVKHVTFGEEVSL